MSLHPFKTPIQRFRVLIVKSVCSPSAVSCYNRTMKSVPPKHSFLPSGEDFLLSFRFTKFDQASPFQKICSASQVYMELRNRVLIEPHRELCAQGSAHDTSCAHDKLCALPCQLPTLCRHRDDHKEYFRWYKAHKGCFTVALYPINGQSTAHLRILVQFPPLSPHFNT